MAEKKYFWFKMKNDFFDRKEIKKLRTIAGGDTYTIIYLKMILKSLNNNGKLYYDGFGENFADELALDIDENVEDVQITITYLLKVRLLSTNDDSEYELISARNLIGTESASAERVRRHRELQKMLHGNVDVTDSNDVHEKPPEIPENATADRVQQGSETGKSLQSNGDVTNGNTDIDIELEIDKEIEQQQQPEQGEAEDGDKCPSTSLQEVADFYMANLNPSMSGFEAQQLRELVEEHTADLVIWALKIAIEYRAKAPLRYIRTPLEDWKKHNLRTLAQVQAQEEKEKGNQTGARGKKVIPEPSWSNPDYDESNVELTEEDEKMFQEIVAQHKKLKEEGKI